MNMGNKMLLKDVYKNFTDYFVILYRKHNEKRIIYWKF